MPGVVQHTRDSLRKAAAEAADLGLGGVMLFGVPEHKDATGSGAIDPDGILNVAITDVVAEVGDALTVMSDLCLDEFTDHGHCGVLDADGRVDNDATLEVYAEMALAQADAGVDMVGPSGMMDGQVGAIRAALDAAGHTDVVDPGLLREVRLRLLRPVPRGRRLARCRATGAPTSRTRPTPVEGVREALLDVEEGADIVMVKPALAYLDVVRRVARRRRRAGRGVQRLRRVRDGRGRRRAAAGSTASRAILETLTSIRRAGADVVLTYWAAEAARAARALSRTLTRR